LITLFNFLLISLIDEKRFNFDKNIKV